jgi:hypothetical protein
MYKKPKLYLDNSQIKNGRIYTKLIIVDSRRQLNKPDTTIDIGDLGDKLINTNALLNKN